MIPVEAEPQLVGWSLPSGLSAVPVSSQTEARYLTLPADAVVTLASSSSEAIALWPSTATFPACPTLQDIPV